MLKVLMTAICTSRSAAAATVLLIGLCLAPQPSHAQLADEHSIEAIATAFNAPIPAEILQKAREFDDQLLSAGRIQNTSVYLVTDWRLQRANTIARRLLVAIGQNPDDWVIRVLDTNPPRINAFVVGGRYVYIYTGLMAFAQSDDELAFVIAHELGHSLLKHQLRRSEDINTTIANIAIAIGQVWTKNRQTLDAVGAGIAASYSRLDEEEADAIGAAIARRAGFDPVQGAGFFSRLKQTSDEETQKQYLALQRVGLQVQQIGAACSQDQQLYRQLSYQTPANYQLTVATCGQYQAVAQQYNQAAQAFNANQQNQAFAPFFSDHPSYDNRVAAIAAVSDFLAGRRDLQSLQPYQQSYRVMAALRSISSPLVSAADGQPTVIASISDAQ
ncbi:MAG: M48 family metallopeptidase [Alphaproteobacteria bacterium]|nr:M48 family metallopeptidase [Alphaproteobacteria bacterium]MDE2495696.1 M48 family metallopeptidase [Alphaproteobacteria bacterium]